MSSNGWVKLHRSLLDHRVWQEGSPLSQRMLVEILLRVTHQPYTMKNGETLYPGEVWTTYAEMGRWLSTSGKNRFALPHTPSIKELRTALRHLYNCSTVSLRQPLGQTGLIISLCNWAQYQEGDVTSRADSRAPLGQGKGRARATEQEDKKERSKEEGISSPLKADIQTVFDRWKEVTGRNGRTELDPKRTRLIERAIRTYGIDDTLAAVEGVAYSDWHMGRDPKTEGKKHNDITLVLRDSTQIEKFRDIERRSGNGCKVTPALLQIWGTQDEEARAYLLEQQPEIWEEVRRAAD